MDLKIYGLLSLVQDLKGTEFKFLIILIRYPNFYRETITQKSYKNILRTFGLFLVPFLSRAKRFHSLWWEENLIFGNGFSYFPQKLIFFLSFISAFVLVTMKGIKLKIPQLTYQIFRSIEVILKILRLKL